MREMIRLRPTRNLNPETMMAMCIDCGQEASFRPVGWHTPTELGREANAAIEHRDRCGQPEPRTPGTSQAPERIKRFVAECMRPDENERVSMEAARDAYDAWPGNEGTWAEYSTFGRWLRQVLPAGVQVVRTNYGGERHNWIIGMTLR